MTIDKKIKFLMYKCRNFFYFEISPFHRIQFFYNHVRNFFYTNAIKVPMCQIEINDVFVISLDYRLDRRLNIDKSFSSLGMNYNFFDGKTVIDVEKLRQYFTDRSIKCLSHGALGCGMSHIELLSQIALSKEGLYLVFEDDVIFSNSFVDQLKVLISSYPSNCDIFYLGSRNNRLRDILHFTDSNYARTYSPRMGAFAYAVTPQGAKTILSYLIPIDLICGGIDTALGKLVRNRTIIAYQFYPTQVFHDNLSLSNIFNPSVPNKSLHKHANVKWPFAE